VTAFQNFAEWDWIYNNQQLESSATNLSQRSTEWQGLLPEMANDGGIINPDRSVFAASY